VKRSRNHLLNLRKEGSHERSEYQDKGSPHDKVSFKKVDLEKKNLNLRISIFNSFTPAKGKKSESKGAKELSSIFEVVQKINKQSNSPHFNFVQGKKGFSQHEERRNLTFYKSERSQNKIDKTQVKGANDSIALAHYMNIKLKDLKAYIALRYRSESLQKKILAYFT